VKSKKEKQRKRYFHYLFLRTPAGVVLTKRKGKDIWQGLYEFPLLETNRPVEAGNLMKSAAWRSLFGSRSLVLVSRKGPVVHQLSHQQIRAVFYELSLPLPFRPLPEGWIELPEDTLGDYPVPVLVARYLEGIRTGPAGNGENG
jgi:A/G-specific adenine glycosylase